MPTATGKKGKASQAAPADELQTNGALPLRRSARARPATAAPAARKAAKAGAAVAAAAPAAVAGAPVPAAAAVTPLRPSAMPRASPLSSGDDVNDWAAQLERAGASRSRAGPLSPLTPTEDDSPRAGRGRQLSNRSEPSPPSKRARGTSSPRTMADDELYVRAAEAAEAYQELEDHYAGRFAEEAERYQQVESAAAACRAKVKEYEQRIAALQAQCECPFLASWGPAFGWAAHICAYVCSRAHICVFFVPHSLRGPSSCPFPPLLPTPGAGTRSWSSFTRRHAFFPPREHASLLSRKHAPSFLLRTRLHGANVLFLCSGCVRHPRSPGAAHSFSLRPSLVPPCGGPIASGTCPAPGCGVAGDSGPASAAHCRHAPSCPGHSCHPLCSQDGGGSPHQREHPLLLGWSWWFLRLLWVLYKQAGLVTRPWGHLPS